MRFDLLRTLPALVLALAVGCAGSKPDIKTFTAKGVDFSQFSTIAFAGPGKLPDGYTRGKLPESLVPIAREVFIATFTGKGYDLIEDEKAADILLVGGVGSKEKTIQNPSPARDGGTFSVAMPEMKVSTGAIAIDAFNRDSGEHVWGGTLEAVMKDETPDPERFREALTGLLDQFPSKSAE